MKREGLHCLVVHPASLKECEEEDRGRGRKEREGGRERGKREGKREEREGGRERGRKVSQRMCIMLCMC